MALITCPECGKKISDKSPQCIHCGYPLQNTTEQMYNVLYLGFSNTNTKYKNQVNLMAAIKKLLNIDDLKKLKEIIDNPPYIIINSTTKEKAEWAASMLQTYKCNATVEKSSSYEESTESAKLNKYMNNKESTIICPRCGSNQITTGQRGFSIWTGFIGASKTANRCAKCGYSWQPK